MRKRKWVVVGVVLVAVSMGAYLLSQPRRGSVEYHKEEFLKAGILGPREDWILSHTPGILEAKAHQAVWARKMKQHDFHRTALVELGYLDKRTFYVRNHEAEDVVIAIMSRGYRDYLVDTNAAFRFVQAFEVETNRFTLVAVRNDMQRWQQFVRDADVPTEE
jgi:hypothetical protein